MVLVLSRLRYEQQKLNPLYEQGATARSNVNEEEPATTTTTMTTTTTTTTMVMVIRMGFFHKLQVVHTAHSNWMLQCTWKPRTLHTRLQICCTGRTHFTMQYTGNCHLGLRSKINEGANPSKYFQYLLVLCEEHVYYTYY
jgi:hypothetical protein